MQDLAILEITECNDDLLETYRCSKQPEIEAFFKEEAMKLNKTGFMKTKVFVDIINYKVIGYFSTNVSEVPIVKGKQDAYNKDTEEEHKLVYPSGITSTPCLTLQRFGISDDYKGKEYAGRKYSVHLMDSVKIMAAEISLLTGILILYVESYYGAREFYESCGFTRLQKISRKYVAYFFPMSLCRNLLDYTRGEIVEPVKSSSEEMVEQLLADDPVPQSNFI